ncbi:MAG: hypothetical protein JO101_11860 [Candidatus Eremiobacteraeota bacterium]|nr:hypothetical protein [Candidatus Eremiobacteraeota bacterium]MBV8356010.1 hypothetical protein [Candidatus Eremiobacteraeota bacterium]
MGLFVRLTLLIALAIVVLMAVAFLLKLAFVAAIIAALVLGVLVLINLVRRIGGGDRAPLVRR